MLAAEVSRSCFVLQNSLFALQAPGPLHSLRGGILHRAHSAHLLDAAHRLLDGVGQLEGRVLPAQVVARLLRLRIAERGAVHVMRARLVGRAVADQRRHLPCVNRNDYEARMKIDVASCTQRRLWWPTKVKLCMGGGCLAGAGMEPPTCLSDHHQTIVPDDDSRAAP